MGWVNAPDLKTVRRVATGRLEVWCRGPGCGRPCKVEWSLSGRDDDEAKRSWRHRSEGRNVEVSGSELRLEGPGAKCAQADFVYRAGG